MKEIILGVAIGIFILVTVHGFIVNAQFYKLEKQNEQIINLLKGNN